MYPRANIDPKILIPEYNSGYSLTDLAKKYKITSKSISRIIKRNNGKTRTVKDAHRIKRPELWNKVFSLKQQNFILNNYNKLTNSQIGKLIRLSTSADTQQIRKFAIFKGLVKIKPSEVNHNFFNKIDTEEKAYIYGFIVGDGCVNIRNFKTLKKTYVIHSLCIALANKDIDILKKMSNIMECKREIRPRALNSSALYINSKQIINDLINYGIIPRKSYLEMCNLYIPKGKLFRHFLRGLMDADGSILYDNPTSKNIRGRIRFCQGIANKNLVHTLSKIIFERYNISVIVKERKEGNLIDFFLHGMPMKKLIEILYKNSTIFLRRKFINAKKIYLEQRIKNEVININWINAIKIPNKIFPPKYYSKLYNYEKLN